MKPLPFFEPGYRTPVGSHLFTAGEIVAFARKYDPQPFHVDPEAARASVLGGLCASGWHTVAMWMRCHRDHMEKTRARLSAAGFPPFEYGPSPGFEKLKWLRPVYAGDTVTYASETLACRRSNSRPGWFVLTSRLSGANQDGKPVIEFESSVLVRYPAT